MKLFYSVILNFLSSKIKSRYLPVFIIFSGKFIFMCNLYSASSVKSVILFFVNIFTLFSISISS